MTRDRRLLAGLEILVAVNAVSGAVYGLAGAGAILVAWIIAEALIIPFSWLQPTFLGVGLLVIALGRRSAREICSVEPRNRDRVSPRPSA